MLYDWQFYEAYVNQSTNRSINQAYSTKPYHTHATKLTNKYPY